MSCIQITSQDPRPELHDANSSQRKKTSRLIESVAAAFAIPIGELRSGGRPARTALARQSAMYLAHVLLGLNFSEVGRIFGRDRTTVAYACRSIETRRDDPVLDSTLCALEDVLISLRDRTLGIRGKQS
jgi:chromosomal replication initiation ATPase DnaA